MTSPESLRRLGKGSLFLWAQRWSRKFEEDAVFAAWSWSPRALLRAGTRSGFDSDSRCLEWSRAAGPWLVSTHLRSWRGGKGGAGQD